MKIFFTALFVLATSCLSAQKIEGLYRKSKPIRHVDFRIDKTLDLIVDFYLDNISASQLDESNQHLYLLGEFSPIQTVIVVDGQTYISKSAASYDLSQSNKYSALIKWSDIKWSDFGSPEYDEGEDNILYNRNWNKMTISLEYSLFNTLHKTNPVPLYASKAEIPLVGKKAYETKLDRLATRMNTNEFDISIESPGNENFELHGIIVKYDNDGYTYELEYDGPIIQGSQVNLKLKLDERYNIRPGEHQTIIRYKNNSLSHRTEEIEILKDIKIINSFEHKAFSWNNYKPSEQKLITITKHDALEFTVETNASSNNGWEHEQSQILVTLSDPSGRKKSNEFIQRVKTDGTASFKLDIENYADGLYILAISGTILSSNDEDQKPIPLNIKDADFYVLKDTRNSITDLTFFQENDKVHLYFKLLNDPSGTLNVYIPGPNNNGRYPLPSGDNKTDPYHRWIPSSALTKNTYANIKFTIADGTDQREIFSFRFFVKSEEDVERMITQLVVEKSQSMGIDIDKPGQVSKFLQNQRTSIANEISTSLMTDFSYDDQAEGQKQFEQECRNIVLAHLDHLIYKAGSKENGFFSSPFGQVMKSIGGLALRYFGIVLV
ncbi:MAG: hypothetical protein RIF33_11650 [Cyclobacteriaceae bacterium]